MKFWILCGRVSFTLSRASLWIGIFFNSKFVYWSFFAPLQKEISVLEFACSFTKWIFSVGVSLLLHKMKFFCWSFFAPSKSIFKTVNLDGSAYLSLNTEKLPGSRRGEFWAFQILTKTSQGSCNLRFPLASEPKFVHGIPKLTLVDTG